MFLTTALQLAEEAGGMHKLSMRKLGKALNVDPTAVYRYFPSKEALVTAMGERMVAALLPADEDLQGDWRARLVALARQAHHVFSTYPVLTQHLASSPYLRTAVGDRLIEVGYQALTEAGLSDEHVVLFHEILYTFALGIGQMDAQPAPNLEDERRVMRTHAASLSAEAFPNARRLAPLIIAESDDVFQLVLEIYLNAVETYASGPTE